MESLRFTYADLNANRVGELSDAQVARLQRIRQRTGLIGLGVVFVMDIIAATLLFFGVTTESVVAQGVGAGVVVCSALMVGYFVRSWMRLGADVRGGAVHKLSGQLERVLKRTGRANVYIVRVEGVDVAVSAYTWQAFAHEQPYHIYRTPYARVLLSAERIEG